MPSFVATCARGTETVLAEELAPLGAEALGIDPGAVRFEGPPNVGYAACMWSRVASRVLVPITSFAASDEDALYHGARAVDWLAHLDPERTLAVDCVASDRRLNTRYLALKTKDAIVDALRERTGRRPDVDVRHPDLRVHVYLSERLATLSVDLSGDALHRRGYRPPRAPAPLKENLAAALLLMARWPERARRGESFVDPMCGSGTLLVEAAWIAADVAPGLLRSRWGFSGWKQHDQAAFASVLAEARRRREVGGRELPVIAGYDAAPAALELARQSVARAGLSGRVQLARGEVQGASPPPGAPPGLVVVNPPYGDRIGESDELFLLYQALGDTLKRRFPGWVAEVLVGNAILAKSLGLRPTEKRTVWNGPIECRYLEIPITSEPVAGDRGPGWRKPSAEAAMFANRLRKNHKRLAKWARREGVSCYRVYDADIPEFNVAVDLYEGKAHVQEYARPRKIPQAKAEARLRDVMSVVPEVLGVAPSAVVLKVRRRQTEGSQYRKVGQRGALEEVHEGGLRFLVNLHDYLDTGLFLDHRAVRAAIGAEARGKRFLNLFAYTCTASVYAAAGGARSTTSVDLSRTYLEWGAENMALNGLDGPRHLRVGADCLAWLEQAHERFDLALLNPPSYSRSHRMRGDFDLVRDHVRLLRSAADRLAEGGVLYFTTHARGFELDRARLGGLVIEDLGERLVPPDFARRPFRAFTVRRAPRR